MADVIIDNATANFLMFRARRAGVFWTSTTVGYVIYFTSCYDLIYKKTIDGGAIWGPRVVIAASGSCNTLAYDCWADWQTAGDDGTKIHIAYISADLNEIRYVYLDTSTDTVGGDALIEACLGTGTFHITIDRDNYGVSIIKTRGGNLAVALKYKDSDDTAFSGFYTSPDAAAWTSKTSPYEAYNDYFMLFPGNEADNQDVWGAYRDVSAFEISLKTFDDDGDSWSEQLISGGITVTCAHLQMEGAIRLSDGHLILAVWNEYDNPAADLMVWDINGAASIVAKTNVLTDSAESFHVSVFINQDNDDIYIAYLKGTTAADLVKVFYQLSQNGGANWDGQTAMQVDVEDDEQWVSCGAVKVAWGGKFQPVWFNDDLNDIFTNTDEGISIAAVTGWTGKIAGVTNPAKIMGVDVANIATVKGVA